MNMHIHRFFNNNNIFVVIFCCLLLLVVCEPDCSLITDPSGSGMHYDLSSLVGKELMLSDQFSEFKATICKNTYECGQCLPGPAGYCQTTEFWQDCIGMFSTIIPMQGSEGVELLYDNGDWGSVGRIKLLCDPSAGDEALNVKAEGTNFKTMVAASKHACYSGGTSGLSLGWAILITLLALTVAYFVAGLLWNHFHEHHTGIELVPHLEFWVGLPSLVKDGALYTVSTVKRLAC